MTTTLNPGELEKVILLATNGGGSGKGGSFWQEAASCGMRSVIASELNAAIKSGEVPAPTTETHFVVGSAYHFLQELWRTNPNITLDYSEPFINPNVAEAIRLFDGYRQHWPADFWGRMLEMEQVLPLPGSAIEAHMKEVLGDVYNIKPDLVVEVDDAAVERARYRGVELRPGRLIVDFKTAGSFNGGDQYKFGLQALAYPLVYNLCHPDTPVQGVVFDGIVKHTRRKTKQPIVESDFFAVFAPARGALEDLRGLVLSGTFNIEHRLKNRAQCHSYSGGTCRFYGKQCDGT